MQPSDTYGIIDNVSNATIEKYYTIIKSVHTSKPSAVTLQFTTDNLTITKPLIDIAKRSWSQIFPNALSPLSFQTKLRYERIAQYYTRLITTLARDIKLHAGSNTAIPYFNEDRTTINCISIINAINDIEDHYQHISSDRKVNNYIETYDNPALPLLLNGKYDNFYDTIKNEETKMIERNTICSAITNLIDNNDKLLVDISRLMKIYHMLQLESAFNTIFLAICAIANGTNYTARHMDTLVEGETYIEGHNDYPVIISDMDKVVDVLMHEYEAGAGTGAGTGVGKGKFDPRVLIDTMTFAVAEFCAHIEDAYLFRM